MVSLPVHSFIQALSHLISGHAFTSEKCLLLLSSGGVSPLLSSLSLHHYWAGSHPHLFHPEFIKDTVIDSIHTVQTQAQLCRILCPQRLDEQGGRTDRHQVPVQEGGSESRRERSWAAHLVADGLVLEPRLVQDFLQLLVVEVGHPDGLGQPCILTLLQGLGGRGGEQSLGMGNIAIRNAEKSLRASLVKN